MFFISLISFGQIDCQPTLGFGFKPINKGIPLYAEPNSNSDIRLLSPKADGIWLSCTNVNLINDFVEVEVSFTYDAFEENGVNAQLLTLYSYLKSDYEYRFNFQEFAKFIMIEENQRFIYHLLINDRTNEWFSDFSSYKTYDISTFQGFYDYWIYYDKSNSDDNYIFKNEGTKVYVHKNDVTNTGGVSVILADASSEHYKRFFNEQLKYKNNNSCSYIESTLMSYFKYYLNALISENEPFKVIQEIKNYEYNFESLRSYNLLNYLKMKASYADENYISTIDIAKNIISLYDENKIINSRENYSKGNIDISRVYAFLISSFILTDNYTDGLTYSKKCNLNINLQFDQHIQFFALSLLNLKQKTEACKILKKAYLDGNEGARKLLKKYCES